MALSKFLIEVLACPDCKVSVDHKKSGKKESLTCPNCRRVFRVENNIPIMMPKEFDSPDS